MKGMKKINKVAASVFLTAGIIAGVAISNTFTVGTSSAEIGQVNDPIVTKGYVDEQIAKLGGAVGGAASVASLEVVTVPPGTKLMVKAGSEVVVRTGKAVAYSSDSNGLSDVTAGVDIKSGSAVPANHLIWFPRDGRGIQVAEDSTASLTVLVKGPYTLE